MWQLAKPEVGSRYKDARHTAIESLYYLLGIAPIVVTWDVLTLYNTVRVPLGRSNRRYFKKRKGALVALYVLLTQKKHPVLNKFQDIDTCIAIYCLFCEITASTGDWQA
eukprot:SAG31_NODE_2837_length_5017_cov_3.496543_4_plen_109_part_00